MLSKQNNNETEDSSARLVYCVFFHTPPLQEYPHKRLFLFSSLAAIYDIFTSDHIGCGVKHLYNLKVPDGAVYSSYRCTIQREQVLAKRKQ